MRRCGPSEEERVRWNELQASDNWRQVRERPRGIQGRFSLCKTLAASGACVYGDKCTFAHSQLERRVWNSQVNFTDGAHSPAASPASSSRCGGGEGQAAAASWKPASAAPLPEEVRRKDQARATVSTHLRGPLGNIFSAARHLHAQRPKSVPVADFRDSPSGTSAWRKGVGTPLSVQEDRGHQHQKHSSPPPQGFQDGARGYAPGKDGGAKAGGTSRSAWGAKEGAGRRPGGGGGSGCQGTDSGAAVVTVEGNKSAATNPLLKVLEGGGEEAKELVRDKGGIEITEATHGNLHVLVACDGFDETAAGSTAWCDGGGGDVPLGGRVRATWVFRVRNGNPKLSQMLVSVCTLDISQPDFRLVIEGEPAASNDRLADERLLRQEINPGGYVDVTLQMRRHQLHETAEPQVQWVIFKFNGFVCARRVSVLAVEEENLVAASIRVLDSVNTHVNESPSAAPDNLGDGCSDAVSVGSYGMSTLPDDLIDREEDVFWDSTPGAHELVPFEAVDAGLELSHTERTEYVLPPEVLSCLEDGRLHRLAQAVALQRSNYRRRLHNCLFVDEFERRKALSRYNVVAATLTPLASWSAQPHDCTAGTDSAGTGVMYAAPGEVLVMIQLAPDLDYEHSVSAGCIRKGDWALLRAHNTLTRVHQAPVFGIGKRYVVVRVKAEVLTMLQSVGLAGVDSDRCPGDDGCKCDVRFTNDRAAYVAMHRAVDAVDLAVVCPDAAVAPRLSAWGQDDAPSLERFLGEPPLDEVQAGILAQIVGGVGGTSVGVPLLVAGAFGTGKSRIIEEAVLQILHVHPRGRVLLCTAHDSTGKFAMLPYCLRVSPLSIVVYRVMHMPDPLHPYTQGNCTQDQRPGVPTRCAWAYVFECTRTCKHGWTVY